MKNLILLLLFIFSGFQFVNAQDLQFSISIKGNQSFANIETNNAFVNAEPGLSVINGESSLNGKTGFEIGANMHLKLDEKIKVISGLAFQQIRFESQTNPFRGDFMVFQDGIFIDAPSGVIFIDQFDSGLPFESAPVKNDIQISYIKIPFLAEIDIVKEKVFFQLGFYGASTISVKSDNSIPAGRFIDPLSSIVEIPDPKDQFTSLLMGLQSGIRVELFKQLSIQLDYSRSMNNLFDEENSTMNANMNNISAGLNWRVDI